MILYRPVGLEELRLIYEAQMCGFPPRLPDQPIFYPVTNDPYAQQIARDWNTKTGTRSGFVTRFSVDDAYASKFERRVVGAREHEELWVPADELTEFNAKLIGPIVVTAAFFGDSYAGWVPQSFGLAGKSAVEQFVALALPSAHSKFDVDHEIAANHLAVYLNFFFWQTQDFTAEGIGQAARDQALNAIRAAWASSAHGSTPLGTAT